MSSDKDFKTTCEAWGAEHLLSINQAALLWSRNTPPPPHNQYLINTQMKWAEFITEIIINRELFEKIRFDLCEAISIWNIYEANISDAKDIIEHAETDEEKEQAEKELEDAIREKKELPHIFLRPFKIRMSNRPLFPHLENSTYIDPDKTMIFREDLAKFALLNNQYPDFLKVDIDIVNTATKNAPNQTRKHCKKLNKYIKKTITEIQSGSKFPQARTILQELNKRYYDELALELDPGVIGCKEITYSTSQRNTKKITYSRFTNIITEIKKELRSDQ